MTDAETTARVRAYTEALLARGTVLAASDGMERQLAPVAIGPAEGGALRDWVVRVGARRSIEVGLGFAVSTLFICEGLVANGPVGRHVAIDPFQLTPSPNAGTTYAGVGLQVLEEAGVRDLVEFVDGESQLVLPRLLGDGRRFDFAFVDGNHRFEAVFLDLVYLARLLEPGSIVFVDDTQLTAIRKAVDFCIRNLGWSVNEEGAEGDVHQWLVLRTGPADRFLRRFTEFTDF